MKILFVGAASPGDMDGDTMEAHVVDGLEGLGANVRYFPFTARRLRRVNRLMELAMTDFGWITSLPVERALLREVREYSPILVLLLLGNYIPPATIEKIRGVTAAPIACWCQDHMGTMGRQYLIGAKFDYIFTKDPVMLDLLKRYTRIRQVHYLPEACNPKVHRPAELTSDDRSRYECDVATAATLYYYRAEILESLLDFDLRIWGAVPRYYRGPLRKRAAGRSLYTREKAACFGAARIVINTLFPMEMGGLNARAFEVAGCGGFQLISHSDAVARYFEPGREIETFRDLDELRDKVKFYLANEERRREIAAAGQRRAHADHTYERRLKQLLGTVGFHPDALDREA